MRTRARWTTLRRCVRPVAVLLLASSATGQSPPPPVQGKGIVKVPAPAGGRNQTIHMSRQEYPAPEAADLSIASDGKDITIGATLKAEPGDIPSTVVDVYFDTDNTVATGGEDRVHGIAGFEFRAELDACVSFADNTRACGGGSDARPTAHWAAAGLERVKSHSASGITEYEEIVNTIGFPGRIKAPAAPIVGKRVEARLSYASLGVKAGQVIRIQARQQYVDPGVFPEMRLTLN